MNRHISLSAARSLGFFAQLEPESPMSSVATLLQRPPAWQALIASPDSEEYRSYQARLRRVERGFLSSAKACQKPELRARQSASMKRNYRGNRYVPSPTPL